MKKNIAELLKLDGRISTRAKYATLELDLYLSGHDMGFEATKQLISGLTQNLERYHRELEKDSSTQYLFQSSMIVALNNVISQSGYRSADKKIKTIVDESRKIVTKLQALITEPARADRDELEKAYQFCLNLAKQSNVYESRVQSRQNVSIGNDFE